MNIKDMKKSLDYLFEASITPFLWGHAGIGKTETVKQYAKEKGYKFFAMYLGAMSDVGDILGLASFVKDENGSEVATTFATPIWLKETIDYCEANPDSGAIIFLDEFNRARRDILNGMFSLALDKTFHNVKLPKNCHIIAAGNPPTDEYYVTDVNDTALMARFAHIKLEPTFNEWMKYAKNAQFESTLISFLQEQPNLLEDSKSEFTLPIKVDRRSYERVNRLFKVNTPPALLRQLMAGIIGVERMVAYEAHLKNMDKPLTGEEVLNLSAAHLEKLKVWSDGRDVKASLVSATCDNVYSAVTEPTMRVDFTEAEAENFTVFLDTLPRESSYALMKKLLKAEVPAFIKYIRDPKFEPKLIEIAKASKTAA